MATEVDIIVLTRDESPIHVPVLAAILAQRNVGIRVHRVIGTPRSDDPNRWATIARARNVGRTLGSTPWVMFVDDDVVLHEDCVSQLVEELLSKPSFAALAADYLDERDPDGVSGHVGMGATIFRREQIARVPFRWEQDRCECQCMANDLRRNLVGIDYSPAAQASHLEGGSQADAGRHTSDCHPDETDAPHETDSGSNIQEKAGQDAANIPDASVPQSPTQATGILVKRRPTTNAEPLPAEETQLPADEAARNSPEMPTRQPAEILVAFDRGHMNVFLNQFLATLRDGGNDNIVHAVTYGIRDRDLRKLRHHNVRLHPQPFSMRMVSRNRLQGFQYVLEDLCPNTPVAYWDAGDVVFQTKLNPLWELVQKHPDHLLVTEEPLPYHENPGHRSWAESIRDPQARAKAFSTIRDKPVYNGGFIAGRAGLLLRYFEQAHNGVNGEYKGIGNGDQMMLNIFMHGHPELARTVDDTWNYCLCGRTVSDCDIESGMYVDLVNDRVVSVVHGNAGTLV